MPDGAISKLNPSSGSRVATGIFAGAKQWGFNCLYKRPIQAQPTTHQTFIHAEKSAPLLNALGLSFVCKGSIVAFVVGLLFSRSPSTIARLVIPVIVNTIKRMVGWSYSHVSQEVDKEIPSVANGNSSSTISSVKPRLRIGATLFHAHPCFVFSAQLPCPVRRMSMLQNSATPATSGFAAAQVGTIDRIFHPASASACPLRPNRIAGAPANNRPFSKLHPSKIDYFHGGQYTPYTQRSQPWPMASS